MRLHQTTFRDHNRLGRSTTKITLPATLAGALRSLTNSNVRLWCRVHGQVCAIVEVTAVTELIDATVYDVRQSCDCVREHTVVVNRSTAARAKLAGEPEPEADEQNGEFVDEDADEVEAYEIRRDMGIQDEEQVESEVTAEITI